jgi:lipid II isoglutaminyl synthase (glutamine-hydrolysing)
LAKNPAGWSELLDLVGDDEGPIVVSINARTADGADPSWLWDVPFERLTSRVVVATGDRCRDLSVRLHYAGVPHVVELDPVTAVQTAQANYAATRSNRHVDVPVDVIGNYTAFDELLGAATPLEGTSRIPGR